MKKLLLFFLGYFFLVLDGVFAQVTADNLQNGKLVFALHFLIIFLVYITLYVSSYMGLLFAFFLGLFLDIVSYGIIGIYVTSFSLIILFIGQNFRGNKKAWYKEIVLSLFAIITIELFAYLVYFVLGKTLMSFEHFILMRLLPTIFLNGFLMLLFNNPLRKLLAKKIRY